MTVASTSTRDSFALHRTRDGKYIVETPLLNPAAESSVLVVSTDGVTVQDKSRAMPVAQDGITASLEICGVIGVLELLFAKYLVVVTARTLAATLQDHKCWRITGASVLPLGTESSAVATRSPGSMSEVDLAKYALDQDLVQQINEIVNSGHLYYSTTYDLTHSLQHNYLLKTKKARNTVVDDRYFFTKHLANPILNAGTAAEPWVLNCICGFAGTIEMDVNLPPPTTNGTDVVPGVHTHPYKLTLLSRLNRRRMGTRYVRRGLDFDGNTSNNVEMEQILYHEDYTRHQHISAFVQIRGSVPSVWGQDLNLQYRPELLIADIQKPKVWFSVKKHFDDLRRQYVGEPETVAEGGADIGKVICVNLLDADGWEGRLTRVYENSVQRFQDDKVMYEEFPVNQWCKNRNFRNMDILVDRVRDRLVNSGWFAAEGMVPPMKAGSATKPLRVHRLQTGAARVSCLDSLDRTNLTCSMFARYMLPYQLHAVTPGTFPALPAVMNGVIPSDLRDPVSSLRPCVESYRGIVTNLWADSGDAISLLYAGTGALKADVTRTGKKTLGGSVTDGINSLTRYYLNNFVDGRRQDGYDLFTGKALPSQLSQLVETEGKKQARRLQQPYIAKGQGILGRIIPGFVIDHVEPVLQTATEYARTYIPSRAITDGSSTTPAITEVRSTPQDQALSPTDPAPSSPHLSADGSPRTLLGLCLATAKVLAPHRVKGVVDLAMAMCVFIYVALVARIARMAGSGIVDRPRLSLEYKNIHDLLD
ncbi:SacI homology domain-containing protein [Phlyctochytrium arcticum]|nr:SacI homology domain-containing protein [Phlyctochytrium arcticum]